MFPLKQSTAVQIQFFAFDSNGDPVTTKIDANWTKRYSQNGSATYGNLAGTVTHAENGMYTYTISTAESNTAGVLTLVFIASGVKQVILQYRVFAVTFDDLTRSLTPANALSIDSSNLAKSDLQTWLTVPPLALASQLVQSQVDTHSAGALSEVAAQVSGQLDFDIAELSAVPPSTASVREALMFLYMIARNTLTASTTQQSIRNDAGTIVAKSTLSDDGTTFTRQKVVNGP